MAFEDGFLVIQLTSLPSDVTKKKGGFGRPCFVGPRV